MILIIGIPEDQVITHFMNFLNDNGHQHIFLNLYELNNTMLIGENYFSIWGNKYVFSDFSGVYPRIAGQDPHNKRAKLKMDYCSLLQYNLEQHCSNVVNTPKYCMANSSKTFQLATLSTKHIQIPRCVISANTSVPHLDFDAVYKSISGNRSIVHKLTEAEKKRSITCPTLFQEYISGNNIRVHVVKEDAFTIEIVSEKVDYRYNKKAIYRPFELPEHIKEECITITRQSGLLMSGIDLILSDNQYYLLEINPAPGYSTFEQYLPGKYISESLYKVLADE